MAAQIDQVWRLPRAAYVNRFGRAERRISR